MHPCCKPIVSRIDINTRCFWRSDECEDGRGFESLSVLWGVVDQCVVGDWGRKEKGEASCFRTEGRTLNNEI